MSLQGQLDALMAHINSLTERVDALEGEVTQLRKSGGTQAKQSSSGSSSQTPSAVKKTASSGS